MFIKLEQKNLGNNAFITINLNQIVSMRCNDTDGYVLNLSNGDYCRVYSEEFERIEKYLQEHNLML